MQAKSTDFFPIFPVIPRFRRCDRQPNEFGPLSRNSLVTLPWLNMLLKLVCDAQQNNHRKLLKSTEFEGSLRDDSFPRLRKCHKKNSSKTTVSQGVPNQRIYEQNKYNSSLALNNNVCIKTVSWLTLAIL